jgi:hypothetical protein
MIEYFLDDLGIVFYTNMVNYPTVLSAQVLPLPLKELAIKRLQAAKINVPNYKLVKQNPILLGITLTQIDGVINYLQATDQNHLWNDCIDFNHRLDHSRDSKTFAGVTPEFLAYV